MSNIIWRWRRRRRRLTAVGSRLLGFPRYCQWESHGSCASVFGMDVHLGRRECSRGVSEEIFCRQSKCHPLSQDPSGWQWTAGRTCLERHVYLSHQELRTMRSFPMGINLPRFPLSFTSPKGLRYDREWVLVDQNGSYLNQKKFPRMTLIRPEMKEAEGVLSLTAPGMSPLTVPLRESLDSLRELKVCGDVCYGYEYSEQVNQWFRTFLGHSSLSLMRMPPNPTRRAGGRAQRASEQREGKAETSLSCPAISYVNESQFLLVTQASVDYVGQRYLFPKTPITYRVERPDFPVTPEGFRPNFVIRGGKAFQEDSWQRLRIGSQLFRLTGPCNRCKMICIDQETGKEGKEPLLTLATFRRDRVSLNGTKEAKGREKFYLEFSRNIYEANRQHLLWSQSLPLWLCWLHSDSFRVILLHHVRSVRTLSKHGSQQRLLSLLDF